MVDLRTSQSLGHDGADYEVDFKRPSYFWGADHKAEWKGFCVPLFHQSRYYYNGKNVSNLLI